MSSDPGPADIVRRVAAENPDEADPRVLATQVLTELEGRERELLERLLPGYIRDVLRAKRAVDAPSEAWDALLAERIPTSDGYRFLRDATADHLDAAAVRREKFAGNLDGRAQQFRGVAGAVRTAGVSTPAEIRRREGARVMRELGAKLLAERRTRVVAERRASTVAALEQRRDQLAQWLAEGTSPILALYRQRRDALLEALDEETKRREVHDESTRIIEETYGAR